MVVNNYGLLYDTGWILCFIERGWLTWNFVLALFPLSIIERSLAWRNVPDKLKERKQVVIKPLLTSRASSTVKRYVWK